MLLTAENVVTFWRFFSDLHKFLRLPSAPKASCPESFLSENQLRAAIDPGVISKLRQRKGSLLR